MGRSLSGIRGIHGAQVAEMRGIGSTTTAGEQELLMMGLQLLGRTGEYPGDPRGGIELLLLLLAETATDRVNVQRPTSIRISIQIIAARVGTQDILIAGSTHRLIEVGLRIGNRSLLAPDLQQALEEAPGRIRRRLETQLTGGGHQGTSPGSPSRDEVPPRQESPIIAGGFLGDVAVAPLEEPTATVHHIHICRFQGLLRVSQFRDPLHIQHKASVEASLDAAYGTPPSSSALLIAILEVRRTVDGVAVGAAIRWPDPVEDGNENGG